MEFRSIFDTIPEQFDRYRPRYCDKLFADLIAIVQIGPGKTVLELGPGTGQATDPVLNTGCNYNAIELGPNLFKMMKHKNGGKNLQAASSPIWKIILYTFRKIN